MVISIIVKRDACKETTEVRQGQAHFTNRNHGKYKLGSLRKDVLHNIYKKYLKLLLKRTSSVQILCNTFSVYTDKSLKKLNSINLLNI